MTWTAENAAEWEEWIASRPPAVATSVRRLVPHPDAGWCVRQPSTGGHYWIQAWQEHEDGSVALRVLHLADSFLPGVEVFGMPDAELEPCGLKDAVVPDEGQADVTEERLDDILVQGQARAAAAGADWDAITPEERRGFLFQ